MKGAYLLITHLNKDTKIKIGAKGLIEFKKGYYIYVGSALNNLEKRIARHKSKQKKIRWHIDYFLRKAKIVDARIIETTRKIECTLSRKIAKIADSSVLGFGCSDCKCRSHLYGFKKRPVLTGHLSVKHLKE